MEEMALRKEIEEKRRKEGKLAEPKLTPKQKEMLDAQLEKEKVVRLKVAKIKHEVDGVSHLDACFLGPLSFLINLHELYFYDQDPEHRL